MTRRSKRSLAIVVSPQILFLILFIENPSGGFTADDHVEIPCDGLVENGLICNMAFILAQLGQFSATYSLTNTKTYCIFDRITYAVPALIEYQWRLLCHNSGLQLQSIVHVDEPVEGDFWQHASTVSRTVLEQEGS